MRWDEYFGVDWFGLVGFFRGRYYFRVFERFLGGRGVKFIFLGEFEVKFRAFNRKCLVSRWR